DLFNFLLRNARKSRELNANTGAIFISITNGFDCLLHKKLTEFLLKELESYLGTIRGSRLSRVDWNGIPFALQKAWSGNHIAIGQYRRLLEELNTENNDIHQHLQKELLGKLTQVEIDIIRDLCLRLENLRNPSAHGKILDYKDFLVNICGIIELSNEVLLCLKEWKH
ncbi:MAG: hypothetical protein ACTSXU_09380, partial [Promethearchaeota archaeon]